MQQNTSKERTFTTLKELAYEEVEVQAALCAADGGAKGAQHRLRAGRMRHRDVHLRTTTTSSEQHLKTIW